MSTATPIPETVELTGDDAWETLRDAGRGRLLKDAFQRMRYADGFSHARSMAFLTTLVLVQGTIAVVGLASVLGVNRLTHGIVNTIHVIAPGPSGRILTSAVSQARQASVSGDKLAIAFGLFGALVSATTAMAQLERGLNRLYGIERDRPALQKYGRAFVLTVTAGLLLVAAFLAIGFGTAIGRAFGSNGAETLWSWLRWPTAVLAMSAAVALLFRWCPRRRQPGWSWLTFGSSVSVVLWFLITLAMGQVFRLSSSFGDTYGPLAGIVALQFWAVLTAMALLFGGAVIAQLEAVRAGRPTPADPAPDDSSAQFRPERRPAMSA
jgi:YihY family inner membrane protein